MANTQGISPVRRSPRNHTSTEIHGQIGALSRQQQPKKQENGIVQAEDTAKDSASAPTLRRSNRNVDQIRLNGTAQTFYRRLQTLFFSPQSLDAYQEIGGKRINLQRMHEGPPIYVIDDFLTESELEYFDACVQQCKFQRSFVDNMELQEVGGGETENAAEGAGPKRRKRTILDTTHRTSTFFGFKKLHDTKITALEQRVANLLGCWVHQIEPLQLVRYLPGEFFNVHHDMGDLMDNDEVKLPKKHLAVKRRLVTLFFYLNTLEPDQGGCTFFPKCGSLRVQPKRGRVVIWSNLTADGLPDPRTIHAGEPVLSQETGFAKYGLNLWICEE